MLRKTFAELRAGSYGPSYTADHHQGTFAGERFSDRTVRQFQVQLQWDKFGSGRPIRCKALRTVSRGNTDSARSRSVNPHRTFTLSP